MSDKHSHVLIRHNGKVWGSGVEPQGGAKLTRRLQVYECSEMNTDFPDVITPLKSMKSLPAFFKLKDLMNQGLIFLS
ncbi:hypothetical protein [Kosakonia sp. S42]|uniref:hypothetical protein n=1 Tax=Kosakonia sp. S42 TaxID=2767458 RepID=UPI00190B1B91|nr:hypothetical protein [Kosakonia sp. S42]MBK0019496.1 hypothetical protein [Kosakonia sp. S42]